jgi:hypothetical protein
MQCDYQYISTLDVFTERVSINDYEKHNTNKPNETYVPMHMNQPLIIKSTTQIHTDILHVYESHKLIVILGPQLQ